MRILNKVAKIGIINMNWKRSVVTKNVFAEATAMSVKYNSVNLGQGFPSFPTDDFVKQAAIKAIMDNKSQYTRPGGSIPLVDTLSKIYSKILKKPIDPIKNICCFAGAQQGIYVILAAMCKPGDEILLIEPCFDAYRKAAEVLDIKVASIETDISTGEIDFDALEAKINEKTRFLITNSPHNPTGKVFTKEESVKLVSLLNKKEDLLLLSDEVYEFLTFDGRQHFNLVSVADEISPKISERVISLSSAGKTFSCTGWRLGYSIASEELTAQFIQRQSVMSFCNATPLEHAFAASFALYFITNEEMIRATTGKRLQKNRDVLGAAFASVDGVKVIMPQGGYFLIVDFTELIEKRNLKDKIKSDFDLNDWLTTEVGVTGIPMSAFYTDPKRKEKLLIRFAFSKTDEELQTATEKLLRLDSL